MSAWSEALDDLADLDPNESGAWEFEMFAWYAHQADLWLQRAILEDEWNEYVTLH